MVGTVEEVTVEEVRGKNAQEIWTIVSSEKTAKLTVAEESWLVPPES